MTIEDHYERYLKLTGSPEAAATLVLAETQSKVAATPEPSRVAVLTPAQVAKQVGVAADTVLDWIASRQLKASNVGKGQKRGRYRVTAEDLAEFLASRKPEPPPSQSRRRRGNVNAGFKRY